MTIVLIFILVDVRTGLFFVAVLCRSSKIYVFGYFNFYQFGRNSSTNSGVNSTPILLDTFEISKIADIVCGGYNSMILTSKFVDQHCRIIRLVTS